MNAQNTDVWCNTIQRQVHEINHILPHKRFFAVHICIFIVTDEKYRNKIVWLCSKKIDFTPFLFCFDYVHRRGQ